MKIKEYLKSYIDFYYPKNIGFEEGMDMDSSEEFNRLLDRCRSTFEHNSFYVDFLNSVLDGLYLPYKKKELDDRILVIHKRCFTLKILIGSEKKDRDVEQVTWVVANLSILGPFYECRVLKLDYFEGAPMEDSLIEVEGECDMYINYIDQCFNELQFIKLSKEILQCTIEDITFERIQKNEFTYFNGFFMNSYLDVISF